MRTIQLVDPGEDRVDAVQLAYALLGGLALGDVAGGREHTLDLTRIIAVDGRVVFDVDHRAGDALEAERVVPYDALPKDALVARPRSVGIGEVAREVGSDEAVSQDAGGFLGGLVDVGDLAVMADGHERVEARLDE